MIGKVNVKDLLFKTLWTGIAGALGYLGTQVADVGAEWVPLVLPFLTLALAFARQQAGETPPDLNPPARQ